MPPAALRLYHDLVTRALAEEAIDESANDDDDAAAAGTATSAVPPIESPPTAWPPLPGVDAPGGVTGETYATLLTTADRRYLAGAVALGSSIRAVEVSGRPLVALVTAAVPESWTPLLESVGWRVVRIEALPEPWWGTHPRCVRYAADENARWGHMFTKLRLFALSNSSSIFYLDADALLLRDPTSLFRSPAAFAAEATAGAHAATFNAGVMRLRPSEATFAALLALSRGSPPSIYRSVVDCTEQALLNLHYDGSNPELTPARFPVARPAAVTAVADAVPVAAPVAAHFITTRCPKPWDVPRALAEAAAAAEEAAAAVAVAEAVAAEAEEDAAKGVGDPSLAEPSLAEPSLARIGGSTATYDVPRTAPGGSTATYNSAAAVPRTAPVLSTAVTRDGGRNVLRQGSGVRPPLRALLLDAGMVHHGGCARNQHKGTARVAIEPRGDACGRRAGIAWAWRRPRRARPRENDPGSDVVGLCDG